MKKIIAVLMILAVLIVLTACSGQAEETSVSTTSVEYVPVAVSYDSDDLDESETSGDMTYINLNGDVINVKGNGTSVDGTTVTITAVGFYSITGTLNNGQIIVNTRETGTIKLVLNGADINCSDSAPIFIINAEKVVITLAENTENSITDGASYDFEDDSDEPAAAVFSKSNLTINGDGSLTVNANYNNGIQSKDALKIVNGTITVTAVNDGIKGRDSLVIKDGEITINASGDGLQSNKEDDASKGYIAIEGGTLDITAAKDGIQAETNVLITGGVITITSGGGSANATNIGGGEWGMGGNMGGNPFGRTNPNSDDNLNDWTMPSNPDDNLNNWMPGGTDNNLPIQDTTTTDTEDTISTKGIKAGVNISIEGGIITIDAADDSLNSNDTIVISGGTLEMATGDDGIHANTNMEINGGNINISKSYEGIESASITINNGNINIVSSDDGINASSNADNTSVDMQRGQGDFALTGDNTLYLNGGYIIIDAGGDGVDVNGPITMTGGILIINGPASGPDESVDYLSNFQVTNGFIVGVGSSQMVQSTSASSTQYGVLVIFDTAQAAGTIIHIESTSGEDILTFAPTKSYDSVLICSAELENGTTYVIYLGGSSTGTLVNGLYSGGAYTPGTQYTTFTISSTVTTLGNVDGTFQTGGGGGMRPNR